MNKRKIGFSLLLFAIVWMWFVFGGIETKAAAGTVTSYEKITWGISTGRYGVNGIHAFCAEYSKSWPPVGTSVDSIVECENEVLKKALYYGYNGPANTLGDDARAHVLTAIAISDANIGERETGASAKYDEFYWDIVNNPEKYPMPPKNFKAYLAITDSSLQNLAFYQVEANGYVKAVKRSSNSELTDGNSCYSLANATYGVYRDKSMSDTAKVGTLTMNADGVSNTVELSPGTYYAYETKAPKGYVKSEEIVSFQVKSKETTTLNFKDDPMTRNIQLLVKKVDADTGEQLPQGEASLQGAQFEVKFYAGEWIEGAAPTRSWVFQTDETGSINYDKAYLVSGDELYAQFPLGTLTIQEIKASEGYLRNDTVFTQSVMEFEHIVVQEQALHIELIKYQTNTELALSGVVFELVSPTGKIQTFTTDDSGKIVITGLCYGTYRLREVETIGGYVLNEEIIDIVVDENTKENQKMVIYNDYIVLPKTGTSARLFNTIFGVVFCGFGILLMKKQTEKRRKKL